MNHRRESASIDFAHEAGKIDVKNFCIQFMVLQFNSSIKDEPYASQIGNEKVSNSSVKLHLAPEL